jgi:hypothetical protein
LALHVDLRYLSFGASANALADFMNRPASSSNNSAIVGIITNQEVIFKFA